MNTRDLDPALSVVALDLLERVLSHGDRPEHAAQALCRQVRALTKARLVAVLRHNDHGAGYTTTVDPDRRRRLLEDEGAARLLAAARATGSAATWTCTDGDAFGGMVREAALSDCRVVPLVTGHVRVGSLLIVDGGPDARVEQVLRAMDSLSKVVALVLRNASLQHESDRLIQERTAELTQTNEALRLSQERYRGLNVELENRVVERTRALAAMNSELVMLNRRLASTVRDLEDTNSMLDEATRAKSQFLANMSHELRTPMNAIIGFSGIMLKDMVGPLSDEQRRQIGMINGAGKHLLELINEVLDLSRIEAGGMEITFDEFDPVRTAEKVVATMRPIAEERRLALRIDCDHPSRTIESDHLRLEQILINLVGNALKFTERGEVSLRVDCVGEDWLFAVTDTGRGIPTEELGRIFDEFYQLPAVDVAKHAGTGLGLSVSRRLAMMLGGSIHVESRLGHGSTFTLRLPVSSSGTSLEPMAVSA